MCEGGGGGMVGGGGERGGNHYTNEQQRVCVGGIGARGVSIQMSHNVRKRTFGDLHTTKTQFSLCLLEV